MKNHGTDDRARERAAGVEQRCAVAQISCRLASFEYRLETYMLLQNVSGVDLGTLRDYDVQNDKFHSIAEGNIHQSTNRVTHLASNALGRERQQCGQGYYCDCIYRKDHSRADRRVLGIDSAHNTQDDAHGHKEQQPVDPAGEDDSLDIADES